MRSDKSDSILGGTNIKSDKSEFVKISAMWEVSFVCLHNGPAILLVKSMSKG